MKAAGLLEDLGWQVQRDPWSLDSWAPLKSRALSGLPAPFLRDTYKEYLKFFPMDGEAWACLLSLLLVVDGREACLAALGRCAPACPSLAVYVTGNAVLKELEAGRGAVASALADKDASGSQGGDSGEPPSPPTAPAPSLKPQQERFLSVACSRVGLHPSSIQLWSDYIRSLPMVGQRCAATEVACSCGLFGLGLAEARALVLGAPEGESTESAPEEVSRSLERCAAALDAWAPFLARRRQLWARATKGAPDPMGWGPVSVEPTLYYQCNMGDFMSAVDGPGRRSARVALSRRRRLGPDPALADAQAALEAERSILRGRIGATLSQAWNELVAFERLCLSELVAVGLLSPEQATVRFLWVHEQRLFHLQSVYTLVAYLDTILRREEIIARWPCGGAGEAEGATAVDSAGVADAVAGEHANGNRTPGGPPLPEEALDPASRSSTPVVARFIPSLSNAPSQTPRDMDAALAASVLMSYARGKLEDATAHGLLNTLPEIASAFVRMTHASDAANSSSPYANLPAVDRDVVFSMVWLIERLAIRAGVHAFRRESARWEDVARIETLLDSLSMYCVNTLDYAGFRKVLNLRCFVQGPLRTSRWFSDTISRYFTWAVSMRSVVFESQRVELNGIYAGFLAAMCDLVWRQLRDDGFDDMNYQVLPDRKTSSGEELAPACELFFSALELFFKSERHLITFRMRTTFQCLNPLCASLVQSYCLFLRAYGKTGLMLSVLESLDKAGTAFLHQMNDLAASSLPVGSMMLNADSWDSPLWGKTTPAELITCQVWKASAEVRKGLPRQFGQEVQRMILPRRQMDEMSLSVSAIHRHVRAFCLPSQRPLNLKTGLASGDLFLRREVAEISLSPLRSFEHGLYQGRLRENDALLPFIARKCPDISNPPRAAQGFARYTDLDYSKIPLVFPSSNIKVLVRRRIFDFAARSQAADTPNATQEEEEVVAIAPLIRRSALYDWAREAMGEKKYEILWRYLTIM